MTAAPNDNTAGAIEEPTNHRLLVAAGPIPVGSWSQTWRCVEVAPPEARSWRSWRPAMVLHVPPPKIYRKNDLTSTGYDPTPCNDHGNGNPWKSPAEFGYLWTWEGAAGLVSLYQSTAWQRLNLSLGLWRWQSKMGYQWATKSAICCAKFH
jgi:hypothetical protein